MSDNLPAMPGSSAQAHIMAEPSIRPGSWWEARVDIPKGWPTGTVVLVTDIEMADGDVHAVSIAIPPALASSWSLDRQKLGSFTMLAVDFLDGHRPLDEAIALARRQTEIGDLRRASDEHQARMTTAQQEMRLLGAASMPLPGLAGPPVGGSESAGIAQQQPAVHSGNLQEALTRRAEAVARAATVIQEGAKAVQTVNQRMALYMVERSQAAMAAVRPALAVAKRLQEQVDTMGLYLGTGVQAQLLVDGPGAASKEKLHLLQRRLFMDEEILIHLESGGADYRAISEFAALLKEDPTLVDRIFGAQRSVVAMACRRKDFHYHDSATATAADVLAAIMKNETNRETFLLVRDGSRVWLVELPATLGLTKLPRLFPTPDDLEAPYTQKDWFKGEGVVIGPDSLDYARATEEYRQLALLYERVLISLWGLHDRLGLFGSFDGYQNYAGFIDPRFQQNHFRLVWDDQNLLANGRPDYQTWFTEKNSRLRSGSRVLVRWHAAITPESAPGVASYQVDRQNCRDVLVYKKTILEKYGFVVARRDGSAIVADCPVSRDRWNLAETASGLNARVDLSAALAQNRTSLLVLDDVDPDDIDYYLNNRASRRDYLDYAGVLVAARNRIREDMEAEREASSELLSAARAGRLTEPRTGWEALVRQVTRDWRADNRGAALPGISDEDWPTVRERLLSRIWFAAGPGTGTDSRIVGAAESAVTALGETPVRLLRDGSSRLVLYSLPAEARVEEAKSMLGFWPFVRRHTLKVSASGGVSIGSSRDVVPAKAEFAGQTLVEAFNGKLPMEIVSDFRNAKSLCSVLETVRRITGTRSVLAHVTPSESLLREVLDETMTVIRERSGTHVQRQNLVQPIGLATVGVGEGMRRISLLYYAEDSLAWLARHADAPLRDGIERRMASIWKNPAGAIERLPVVGSPPRSHVFREVVKSASQPLVAETYSGAFFEAVSSERSRGAWLGDMKGHRSVADFVRSVLADRYRTGDHLWLNTGIMEALEELAFTADEAAPSP